VIRTFARTLGVGVAAVALAGAVSLPAAAATGSAHLSAPLHVAVLNPPSVSSTTWSWDGTPVPGSSRFDPPVVVTPSGGVGPYTFSWQETSGDPGTSAASPASSTTNWSRQVPNSGLSHVWSSTWVCVVTDATGASAATPTVSVFFSWENGD
jgi:hypothetical protein